MGIRPAKHRRAVKTKLFRRDLESRGGGWGSKESPFGEPRTTRWIRCYYCGDHVKVAYADIAHIVAHCRGGSDLLENLVLAHPACNNEEGRKYNEPKGTVK